MAFSRLQELAAAQNSNNLSDVISVYIERKINDDLHFAAGLIEFGGAECTLVLASLMPLRQRREGQGGRAPLRGQGAEPLAGVLLPGLMFPVDKLPFTSGIRRLLRSP
ncbi:hypothetical protein Tco_0399951 [Tanacetum coccineum]